MNATPILTNFTAGEISPQLAGRTDVEKYANGCRILENFISRVHGGAERRPGTYFVSETKNSAKLSRLIKFEFSVDQAYVIEIGDQYFRFYMDQGQIVLSGDVPYELATPYLEADIWNIKFVQDADTMYLVCPGYAMRVLTRTGHTAWTIEEAVFLDGPYQDQNITDRTMAPSGTSGDITITTAGVSPADLWEAGHIGLFVRILHGSTWGYAKITAITSPTVAQATVIKNFGGTSATKDWRLGFFCPKFGYPEAISFIEQRLALACNTEYPQHIMVSKSGGAYLDHTPGAEDSDPIVYRLSGESVNVVRWLKDLGGIIAGTTNAIWSFGPQDSDTPLTPSNPVAKPRVSKGCANIPSVNLGNCILFVERDGHPDNFGVKVREFSYQVASSTAGFYVATDLTLLAEHITKGGIADMAFQQSPTPILWAVRSDGLLLGMTYEREQDVVGWHQHPTDGIVESICVIPGQLQDELWMIVRRDINGESKRFIEFMVEYDWGTTKDDDHQERCFFVDCGLSYDGEEADITGVSLANPVVVTAPGHPFVNGQQVRISLVEGTVELNRNVYTVANADTDTFELEGIDGTDFTAYVSGGLAKRAVSAVSGLDHLEGKTVAVLADGGQHNDRVVSSGSIPIDPPASVIAAGLPYTSILETMDLDVQTALGTAQGKIKRVNALSVLFYRTLGGFIGQDEDSLDEIIFREDMDSLGEAPELKSQMYADLPFPGDFGPQARIRIEQRAPLPMTVLAIMPKFEVNE